MIPQSLVMMRKIAQQACLIDIALPGLQAAIEICKTCKWNYIVKKLIT
jgi:hypothetical protein